MTWYEFFLFVHISMAVIWVGGGLLLQILALRVMGTRDDARLAAFAGDAEVLGMRVFAPSSVLLLLAGVGLVLNADWSWSEPFIAVGLVVWLISFVAGIAYLGPSSGRIKAEISANGMSPRAQKLIGNTLRYSRIELVLLWIVLFMMVVKLGT